MEREVEDKVGEILKRELKKRRVVTQLEGM